MLILYVLFSCLLRHCLVVYLRCSRTFQQVEAGAVRPAISRLWFLLHSHCTNHPEQIHFNIVSCQFILIIPSSRKNAFTHYWKMWAQTRLHLHFPFSSPSLPSLHLLPLLISSSNSYFARSPIIAKFHRSTKIRPIFRLHYYLFQRTHRKTVHYWRHQNRHFDMQISIRRFTRIQTFQKCKSVRHPLLFQTGSKFIRLSGLPGPFYVIFGTGGRILFVNGYAYQLSWFLQRFYFLPIWILPSTHLHYELRGRTRQNVPTSIGWNISINCFWV